MAGRKTGAGDTTDSAVMFPAILVAAQKTAGTSILDPPALIEQPLPHKLCGADDTDLPASAMVLIRSSPVRPSSCSPLNNRRLMATC